MVKKVFLSLVLMLFIPFGVSAEELELNWVKGFGGNDYDYLESAVLTDDEGFIILSSSGSTDIDGIQNNGGDDAIIVKYDKDGNIIWQKSWGGNEDDILYDLVLLDDGSFISFGISFSTDIDGLINKGKADSVVVKYDKNGNLLWQKSWGGSDSDYFRNILLMDDESFFIIGDTYSTDVDGFTCNGGTTDAVLIKYDKDGNVIWQKSWGGTGADKFSKILYINKNEFLIAGSSSSRNIDGLVNNGSDDIVILKYNIDGNLIWQKSWGRNYSDMIYKIDLIEDDEFVICGGTFTLGKGGYDAVIVKYDKDGNLLWEKSEINYTSFIYSIVTTDGTIIVSESGSDTLIKYDKEGNVVWKKDLGGENLSDYFTGLLATEDGGFIAYGALFSTTIPGLINKGGTDDVIVKYDKDGNIVWKTSFGGNSTDRTYLMLPKNKNSFIKFGYTKSNDIDGIEYKDAFDLSIASYYVKYNFNNIQSENGTFTSAQEDSIGIITPKPNEGYVVDKVIVKNSKDELVDVVKQEDGTYSFSLDDDVSVEVLFKEEVVNPKTGVIDIISTLLVGFVISFIGYTLVKKNCYRYDL